MSLTELMADATPQQRAVVARALGQLLVRATGAYVLRPACHHWDPPTPGQDVLDWQNDRCAACGRVSQRLVTDHCHRTGLHRGDLCHGCNVSEGLSKGHSWSEYWHLYRIRPPSVICGDVRPWRGGRDPCDPLPWVVELLGPVPTTQAALVKYLRDALFIREPARFKDNATEGLL